jgi:hypothetical protein
MFVEVALAGENQMPNLSYLVVQRCEPATDVCFAEGELAGEQSRVNEGS